MGLSRTGPGPGPAECFPTPTHLFGICLLLCSGLITRTLQQHEAGDEGKAGGGAAPYRENQAASACNLCDPRVREEEGEREEGEGRCRCKLHKYLSEGDEVKQFYNIDQCTGFRQVPNFTSRCSDDVLELTLNGNHFAEVGGYAFQGLGFLENDRYMSELRLSNVSLMSLDPMAFEGIRGVVNVLDLSHNHLGTVPEAIANLPYLQKLLLNDNMLTMEALQPALDKECRNGSVHLESIKIIDLANNFLTGVPDLRPRTEHSSQLQELRLHGNPITQDLSVFAPLLARHRNLQKVTWPLHTASCTCVMMVTLAWNIYSDFNFPVIYPLGEDASGVFTEWHAITCDKTSAAAFVGRPIGLISDKEVREECAKWANELSLSEMKPSVTQAASGYTVIRPAMSASGNSRAIQTLYLAVAHLGVLLILQGVVC